MDKEGSSPAHWIPGRWIQVAEYQVDGSRSLVLGRWFQVAGSAIIDLRPARAEFGSFHQDESCAIFLGKESLTRKHLFWKGSC
ncbi:UNVERIFIED_CONTAM: hypothetical protein Slati_1695600 [Sesamum latifolium]|uniref:Uncharacterized protein n=1 Tax=Sesamum latifolium TaxID=2727402 RepID=A0AAW2WUY8_9LAMI